MVPIDHFDRINRRSRMPSVITTKQLVVQSPGRIVALSIVQRQKGPSGLDKIPNGLLLIGAHPLDVLPLETVGPIHAVTQYHQKLLCR